MFDIITPLGKGKRHHVGTVGPKLLLSARWKGLERPRVHQQPPNVGVRIIRIGLGRKCNKDSRTILIVTALYRVLPIFT